ncbi:hypothetical protein R4Z10_19380 [Niallia sp. XMNu-256]
MLRFHPVLLILMAGLVPGISQCLDVSPPSNGHAVRLHRTVCGGLFVV